MSGNADKRDRNEHNPADEVARLRRQVASREDSNSRWWRAFHMLVESEQRLRSLLWHTATLLAVLDADGTILYISPACERILGYRPDELAGLEFFTLVHPQDADDLHAWLDGTAHAPERVAPIDCRVQHHDGTWRVLAMMGGIIADDLAQASIVLSAHDVTERRRIEREQGFLASIVRTTTDSIIGKTLDGMILSWNPGAELMYGYSAEEAVGQPIGILFPPDKQDELDWVLGVVRRGEIITGHETQRLRKDGTVIKVSLTVSPVRDRDGSLIGASAIAHDITHRKEIEQEIRELNVRLEERVKRRTKQLEEANRELEAFTYSVSHDLRAPLRAMDGFSRILINEYVEALPEQAAHYLERVRKNAQEMGALIDDLLALSRLTREAPNRQTVDPAAIARQALDELAPMQAGREVVIEIEDMPPCEADPRLLERVFANLLQNALKYTRPRDVAKIRVRSVTQNGQTIYVVEDNGVGFDMTYAEKMFGVFQRLHRAEEFEGTGIGLAIVQRIVHRHGGRVWAEAKEGEGAVFYFTLEREDDE
jgi:PAS domain S-box-containing protein